MRALRLVYRAAYVGATARSRALHPRMSGVKCVVRDPAGRVVFVRHAYGDRAAWELPGGGRHRGEDVVETAHREAAEELGLDLAGWRELGTMHGVWTGTRLELGVCEAAAPAGARLVPDPVEIAAAVWADPAAPPGPLGPVTASALALVPGAR